MGNEGSAVFGLILLLLFTALGYFTYGVDYAIVMFILGFLYYLSTIISLIPFVGCVIQAIVMKYIIWSYVSEMVMITASLLTLCMFWCFVVYGIIITLLITILTIAIIKD